jgi:hypothetical protein
MIIQMIDRDKRLGTELALERFIRDVCRPMNLQRRFGLAHKQANLTGKGWPLHAGSKSLDRVQLFVPFSMLVQIVALDESLVAKRTLIALLARVDARVPLQILVAFERFRAHIADERRFGDVAQPMSVQIAHDEKSFRTRVTLVRFSAVLVRLGVLEKVRLVLETFRTDVALKGANDAGVHGFVGEKRLLRLERLAADGTLEGRLSVDGLVLFQILHHFLALLGQGLRILDRGFLSVSLSRIGILMGLEYPNGSRENIQMGL